jgi:hypothetical protein
MDFAEQVKKDIVERLKKEIETVPIDKLADTALNILLKGKDFGLTEKDTNELRESFKKRLMEAV